MNLHHHVSKSLASVAVLIAAFCVASARGDEQRPIAPVIQFSQDEQTVSIRYEKGEWNLHRPLVSPWKYTAVGKMYWVDPTGNDDNDGSTEKPLKTIGKAVTQAVAGDIIYIRQGTYIENVLFTKSGEEGKPIILSRAPDALGKVRVTPPKEYVEKNPGGAVITLRGSHHVWINGLVIEGPRGRPEAPAMETYGANGITWAGKAGEGCRATNNVVYANVHCGMKEMGHGGTKITLEANIIFDNGTESRDHGIYCPADDLTINGNIIFNNAGYGIHSYSHPKHQVITRNICFANRVCGIILSGSDCEVSSNICAYNGMGIMYFRGGCKNNTVKNNIFAFNKTDCAYDNGGGKYGDPSGNNDDANCYFPGKPDERIHPGSHEILADPQFIDAKKGDFRLKEQSPCKGADAFANADWRAVIAIRDVLAGLEDRRMNGEPLTPRFIELMATMSHRMAEAELQVCTTNEERRSVANNYVRLTKDRIPLFYRWPGPMPQMTYHVLSAEIWATKVLRSAGTAGNTNQTRPSTQPTASDLAEAAQKVYELLSSRAEFSIEAIEMQYLYSRRWAEAKRDAVATPAERNSALQDHVQRMKDLRETLRKNRDAVGSVQLSQADFYIAEAEMLVAILQAQSVNERQGAKNAK